MTPADPAKEYAIWAAVRWRSEQGHHGRGHRAGSGAHGDWPGESAQFSATVTGTTNTTVQWSILSGGAGTIYSGGLYQAPGSVAETQAVIIRAVSDADPNASSTSPLTLRPRLLPRRNL